MRRILLCTALLAPFFLGASTRAADSDEVAKLKARVQELEKQVEQLKQQLAARQASPALPRNFVNPYSLRAFPPAQPSIPPDAHSFQFNGGTVYLVPLSGTQSTALRTWVGAAQQTEPRP
jgi:hypothetical protein